MTIDPQTGEIAWTPTTSPVPGLPSVPGFSVEVYTLVEDPFKLSFDPSGVLYAGRDKSGSGGSAPAAVKVHRIGGGGSPVSEYGASPLPTRTRCCLMPPAPYPACPARSSWAAKMRRTTGA